MNKHNLTVALQEAENETAATQRVLALGCSLMVLLAGFGWLASGWPFALSVVIGGALVNGSFWLLKMDAQRLIARVSESDGARADMEKTRFFLRSFARLVVLGLLLFVLASQVTIHVIGLTLGFATIMVSVVIIGMRTGKCWMPSKA